MPRRRSGGPTGFDSSRTSPEVGVSSPPTMRMSVVLPQPEGPTNTTNSLRATSSVNGAMTSSRPEFVANDLVTSSKCR